MAEIADTAKDVVHAVEHPIETAKALEHEAEEGASARALLLAITMTLYFVYGGR
jgi:hypothetical protein